MKLFFIALGLLLAVPLGAAQEEIDNPGEVVASLEMLLTQVEALGAALPGDRTQNNLLAKHRFLEYLNGARSRFAGPVREEVFRLYQDLLDSSIRNELHSLDAEQSLLPTEAELLTRGIAFAKALGQKVPGGWLVATIQESIKKISLDEPGASPSWEVLDAARRAVASLLEEGSLKSGLVRTTVEQLVERWPADGGEGYPNLITLLEEFQEKLGDREGADLVSGPVADRLCETLDRRINDLGVSSEILDAESVEHLTKVNRYLNMVEQGMEAERFKGWKEKTCASVGNCELVFEGQDSSLASAALQVLPNRNSFDAVSVGEGNFEWQATLGDWCDNDPLRLEQFNSLPTHLRRMPAGMHRIRLLVAGRGHDVFVSVRNRSPLTVAVPSALLTGFDLLSTSAGPIFIERDVWTVERFTHCLMEYLGDLPSQLKLDLTQRILSSTNLSQLGLSNTSGGNVRGSLERALAAAKPDVLSAPFLLSDRSQAQAVVTLINDSDFLDKPLKLPKIRHLREARLERVFSQVQWLNSQRQRERSGLIVDNDDGYHWLSEQGPGPVSLAVVTIAVEEF